MGGRGRQRKGEQAELIGRWGLRGREKERKRRREREKEREREQNACLLTDHQVSCALVLLCCPLRVSALTESARSS